MKSHVERHPGPVGAGVIASLVLLLALGSPGRAAPPAPPAPTGPAADYPIVLGPAFTIDGVTYTPADKLNLDQVGYAVIDPAAGPGISIAHRTLPLPSYAEVTSLRTGRTILVRVERRGPPNGSATVALSPAAAAQLGASEALTPIRIRRVNPPEPERAALRAGQAAPPRMDTPLALVSVLMRKLDPAAAAAPASPIASATAAPAPAPFVPVAAPAPASGPVAARVTPAAAAVTPKQPAVMPPQLKPAPAAPAKPTPPAANSPTPPSGPAAKLTPKPESRPVATAGRTIVQVGAFANRASADKVAARVGGSVSAAGKLFRVRIGGLATPQAAAAALAKVRAAGYSEARIQHAD